MLYQQWKNAKVHLLKGMQTIIDPMMRQVYQSSDPAEARRILKDLTHRLEEMYSGASASLREGLDETLTAIAIDLGLPSVLRKSLQTTNIIESALLMVREVSRNVKYCQNGRMVVRWAAIGFMEVEKRFR